ncbi:MAG: ornithine cyclodeaminase [Methylibium sp. NZG]|nr:MAG: ornithine cyclodeaminase [Methylibium sp. NZG]
MRFVDAATTAHHLAFDALIAALRSAFVTGCEVPLRHTHLIADATGAGPPAGTVLLMPAWRPGGRLGLKTVSIFPANRARGQAALHSVYTLFDASTGLPLAQLDGDQITSRRTAAASALAASFLAREDASRLLVVGTGRVARLMAQAMRAVRPIVQVEVWGRNAASAHALAEELAEQGFDACAAPDLPAAVARAHIVSCATLANEPLVRGAWLAAGTHLDLVGSFKPDMRETDAECFARCHVFCDTEEALAKSGDVLHAIGEGAFSADAQQGTLAQLCRGERNGRRSAHERTLFKSVGTALEDLAAAELVFDALPLVGDANRSVC